MNWTNLGDMVKDLDLTSNPNDIQQLKTEIKKLMAGIHPDHLGSSGDFKSDDDKTQYFRLAEVLKYCETFGTTLVPIEAVTSLVKDIVESITHTNKEPVESRITKASTEMISKFHQEYKLPKISLGVISAALIYAFLFPQTIINHPYLSKLLDNQNFFIIWFVSVLSLAILWFFAWMRERNGTSKIKKLSNLDTQRDVLTLLRQYKNPFSRSDLKNSLSNKIHLNPVIRVRTLSSSFPMGFFNDFIMFYSNLFTKFTFKINSLIDVNLDSETLDEVTYLAIERYLEKNWIQRVHKSDMDDWYEIIV